MTPVSTRMFVGLVMFGTSVLLYQLYASHNHFRIGVVRKMIKTYISRPPLPRHDGRNMAVNHRKPTRSSTFATHHKMKNIISDKPSTESKRKNPSHRVPSRPPISTTSNNVSTKDKISQTVPPTISVKLLSKHLIPKKEKTFFDLLSPWLHHLVPRQPSSPDGYLEVPHADMTYTGDIEAHLYRNPSDAVRRCNSLPDCKAFISGSTLEDGGRRYYMKSSFSVPIHSDNLNLFIKREFLDDYLRALLEATNTVCAIPIYQIDNTFAGCNLPVLDPFDPSIMKFIEKQKPAKCDGRLYTRFEKGVLSLADNAKEHVVKRVEFKTIVRRSTVGNNDFDYGFGHGGTLSPNNTQAKIDNDYLVATVHFKNDHKQTDIHVSVSEKPSVRMRKQQKEAPLDIMIIAFDSTSAAHFQRMLPETFQFLKEDLKSDIFRGYSIVGEATTPAMSAMLTGVSLQENCNKYEGRTGYPNARTVDEWPFIFKELHSNGFATMWSEDDPLIGSFHLRLKGFEKPPVDHFAHNFWYYPPRTKLCHGSQIQFMIQLNYLKSFMTSYKGIRKFGFTFLSDLCHQTYSHVGVADTHVAGFLKSLRDENLLNNTMLVVMGDHGPRFGDPRQTMQGRLEEALPFLSITLPQWFKERFPQQMSNLHGNNDVLLAPFDLHATFRHLINFSPDHESYTKDHEHSTKENPGISLFREIPRTRTCLEAQIPSHFCPCIEHRNISTAHAHITTGALAVVKEINRRLSEDPAVNSKCSKVTLQKVVRGTQSMPGKDIQLFHSIQGGAGLGIGKVVYNEKRTTIECDYQVQIITTPGGCRFESSFRVKGDSYYVSKNIFRINAYGDQPKCIAKTHPHLRDFCVCL